MGNTNKGSSGVDNALILHRNGNAKRKLGDYIGAIVDYNESLRLRPNNEYIFLDHGCANTWLGEYKGAIDDFNSALHINPNNFDAYINLGWVHSILGNYETALHHYTKALDLIPCSVKALNERAMIYQIIGNAENAKNDRQKARRFEPQQYFTSCRKTVSEEYLECAINEMKKPSGNYKLAFMYCDEAIRLHCENPDAYLYRTQAYNMMINEEPNIDRGNEYEIRIYEEDYHGPLPDARSYFRRGNEKLEARDYLYAIDDYDDSLRLDPNNEEALLNRGVAQCR